MGQAARTQLSPVSLLQETACGPLSIAQTRPDEMLPPPLSELADVQSEARTVRPVTLKAPRSIDVERVEVPA